MRSRLALARQRAIAQVGGKAMVIERAQKLFEKLLVKPSKKLFVEPFVKLEPALEMIAFIGIRLSPVVIILFVAHAMLFYTGQGNDVIAGARSDPDQAAWLVVILSLFFMAAM